MFVLNVAERPFSPGLLIGEIATGRARGAARLQGAQISIRQPGLNENAKIEKMKEIAMLQEHEESFKQSFSDLMNYVRGYWTMLTEMRQTYKNLPN